MKINQCKCGSDRILVLTFVACKDCGSKTKNYQCSTGEYQTEEQAAISDWNNGILYVDKSNPIDCRNEFEAWYISKFLNVMGNAQEAVIELRNDFGGYDDNHMDGAWECWKKSEQGIDLQCRVKVSAAQAFIFIVLMMAVTGLLYWVCFSGEFYEFLMGMCDSCK